MELDDNMDTHEKSVEYWKKLAEARQNELNELIEMSTELEAALESRLQSKTDECVQTSEMLLQSNKKIETFQIENEKLRQSLDQQLPSSRTLRSNDSIMKNRTTELETESDQLRNKLRAAKATVNDLGEQLDEAIERNVFLEGEKQDFLERTNTLEAELVETRLRASNSEASETLSDDNFKDKVRFVLQINALERFPANAAAIKSTCLKQSTMFEHWIKICEIAETLSSNVEIKDKKMNDVRPLLQSLQTEIQKLHQYALEDHAGNPESTWRVCEENLSKFDSLKDMESSSLIIQSALGDLRRACRRLSSDFRIFSRQCEKLENIPSAAREAAESMVGASPSAIASGVETNGGDSIWETKLEAMRAQFLEQVNDWKLKCEESQSLLDNYKSKERHANLKIKELMAQNDELCTKYAEIEKRNEEILSSHVHLGDEGQKAASTENVNSQPNFSTSSTKNQKSMDHMVHFANATIREWKARCEHLEKELQSKLSSERQKSAACKAQYENAIAQLNYIRSEGGTASSGEREELELEVSLGRRKATVDRKKIEYLELEVTRLQDEKAIFEQKISSAREAQVKSTLKTPEIEDLKRKNEELLISQKFLNDRCNVLDKELRDFRRKASELAQMLDRERENQKELKVIISKDSGLTDDLIQVRRAYLAQLRCNTAMKRRVRDVCGNVIVGCRIRPLTREDWSEDCGRQDGVGGELDRSRRTSTVRHLSAEEAGFFHADWTLDKFTFDRVFAPECSQYEIYRELEHFGVPEFVVAGGNACVVTYGQANSGKTYTLEGTREQSGLIANMTSRIMELTKMHELSSNAVCKIDIAIVEISLSEAYDLLAGSLQENGTASGSFQDSSRSGRNVKNIPRHRVRSVKDYKFINCATVDDVVGTIFAAKANSVHNGDKREMQDTCSITVLRVFSTASNKDSEHFSLGSACKTRLLPLNDRNPSEDSCGILYFVDPSGFSQFQNSETFNSLSQNAQESKSLTSTLKDILTTIGTGENVSANHGSLGQHLKPIVDGEALTFLMLTVSSEIEDSQETLESLRFAQLVRSRFNVKKSSTGTKDIIEERDKLKSQLKNLKSQHASTDSKMRQLKDSHTHSNQSFSGHKDPSRGTDPGRKRLEIELRSATQKVEDLRKQNANLQQLNQGYKESAKSLEQQQKVARRDLASKNATLVKQLKEKDREIASREQEIKTLSGEIAKKNKAISRSVASPSPSAMRRYSLAPSDLARSMGKSRQESSLQGSEFRSISKGSRLSSVFGSPRDLDSPSASLRRLSVSSSISHIPPRSERLSSVLPRTRLNTEQN